MKSKFSKSKKPIEVPELNSETEGVVKLRSMYIYSDWTSEKKHDITLEEVIGFKLHWRGDWHVEVVPKSKDGEKASTYELSHFVYEKQISEMIADDRIKILGFNNYHRKDGFLEALDKVMTWAEGLRHMRK